MKEMLSDINWSRLVAMAVREREVSKMSDECINCGDQIWCDTHGIWVDNSGGDVCGYDGTDCPHVPFLPGIEIFLDW